MTDIPREQHESPNSYPGQPLRKWDSGESITPWDARLVLGHAQAHDAVRRLLAGEPLSKDDLIVFGKLNSMCFQSWYEPMVFLIDKPTIAPETAEFLQNAVPELAL